MNHNLYEFHEERLAEIRREIEHLRLVKKAGLSEPGWLARAGKSIRSWLAMRINRQQVNSTRDYRNFPRRTDQLPQ